MRLGGKRGEVVKAVAFSVPHFCMAPPHGARISMFTHTLLCTRMNSLSRSNAQPSAYVSTTIAQSRASLLPSFLLATFAGAYSMLGSLGIEQ